MLNLSREKTNMLSSALLSELAFLSIEKNKQNNLLDIKSSARYASKDRAKILLSAPEEVKDLFSLGYVCGFVGRFIQLEEERAGLKPSDTLPKNIIAQILTDIFGKMRANSLVKIVFNASNAYEDLFVKGYYSGGKDLDKYISCLAENSQENYPHDWYDYLKTKIKNNKEEM